MLKKQTWQNIASIAGACLVAYFLYHTIQGDHGWMAMLRLKGEVENAQSTLGELQKEHEELEHRVQMLRADHIDPDMLDEQSRAMLNYSKPNEIIVLTPHDDKPDKPSK